MSGFSGPQGWDKRQRRMLPQGQKARDLEQARRVHEILASPKPQDKVRHIPESVGLEVHPLWRPLGKIFKWLMVSSSVINTSFVINSSCPLAFHGSPWPHKRRS